MRRPLAEKRPIGPFAQMSKNSGLKLVVFTDKNIPQSAADDIKTAAENEMGREMGSVNVMGKNTGFVIDTGPEVLLEHEEFKTYEDMVSAITDGLSQMMGTTVKTQEITARC